MSLRVVLTNCSAEQAPQLARALVEEGLAACVNILPGVQSHYVWKGQYCIDEESTLLIKSTAKRLDALTQRLRELHSYEVPEIIALDTEYVLDDYLQWAKEQVE